MTSVKAVVLGGSGIATPHFVDEILQIQGRTRSV